MNDKQIIDQYFNNYFSNKKKKIYNEDLLTGFAIGAFLYFLFYILLRTFTINKYEKEAITTKLEDNPKQVQQIIKFLDEIKRIIKNDITNKKLDKAFNIIDSLDNSLLSFKKNNDSQKSQQIVTSIIDNIKLLLEEILNLYGDQNKEKKENIFNKLKFILNQFGLSQKFELILKQVLENNNNIIKNDEKENVTVKPEEVENVIASDVPKFEDNVIDFKSSEVITSKNLPTDQEDELTEMEVEEDDDMQETDEEKISREKKEKIEKLSKKADLEVKKQDYIEKVPQNIKLQTTVALHMLNEFTLEDVVELYDVLNSGATGNDLIDKMIGTLLFTEANKIIEDKEIIQDYTNLSEFFITKGIKTSDLIIDVGKNFNDDKYTLNVKIYKDKFSDAIISPLKENDFNNSNFKDFYVLSFIKEPNKNSNIFNIRITKDQKNSYQLFKNDRFIYEQAYSFPEHDVLICTGTWDLTEGKLTFKLKFESGFDKIVETSKDYKILIFKQKTNSLVEIKNIPRLDPETPNINYYFCIRIKDEYFLIKITKDFFPNVTNSLIKNGTFFYKYLNQSLKKESDSEIKNLIRLYVQTTRNRSFLKFDIPNRRDEDNTTEDIIFFKINPDAIDDTKMDSQSGKPIININTNLERWKYD